MNLSELEKIVNDGKAKLKAYENADVALSQVKALAQYEKETRANLDAGLAEIEKVKKSVEAWKAKELDAKNNAESVADNANEEAKAIVAQAKSEAQAFLGKAVLDADKQRQDAFKVKADADAYVEAKKAEALDWEAKANAAKAAHDAYKAALAG